MKVAIVVTHLLGSGHLSRALTLARAFAEAGHDVRVLAGGMPAPHLDSAGVRLVQLPPLRSDGVDFSRLLDSSGAVAGVDYHAKRQTILRNEIAADPPDVLITELFPFGRRTLKSEFETMLRTATQLDRKPLILSSVRDILAPPSKSSKAAYAETQIDTFYDGVLVHSNPMVTPLDLSWPVTPSIAQKLAYTGFVAPPVPRLNPDAPGRDEIIVSAGGGTVGSALFETALEAAKQKANWKWRILVGGQNGVEQIATLRASASENVSVEPTNSAFREMLCHAKASVSMCGYNTAIDVLQTGAPAVFVPFDAGGEVEQSLRAKALAVQDGIVVVQSAMLSAQSLIDAVNDALAAPQRDMALDGFDGAHHTVAMVTDWMAQR